MGLRDTVCSMSTDPPHDGAKVAQKVTVEGGKGTTSESEFGSTVVGEQRVGVLQEGNQNQPVVNPKIRDDIYAESLQETIVVDGSKDTTQPEEDAQVGD